MSDTLINFLGSTIITVLFLAAAIVLVASNHTVGNRARRVFLLCLTSLAFIAVTDWINYSSNGIRPDLRWFQIITNAITFSIAPVLPTAIAHTIFPDRYFRIVLVVLVGNALLQAINIFGGFIFTVDEANVYHRGPLYVLYMASYIVSAVYLSVESIRAGRTYQSANLLSILMILAVLGIGVGIQVYDGTIRTTWPAVSMAVVLYFLFYVEMVLRTDALTKLLNRHSYLEFLERPPLPCAVVQIDVNRFKQVNDNYGHAFGDECLATLAACVRHAYAHVGLCYRTGGDEYTVVVTKGLDQLDELQRALEEQVAKAQAKDARVPGVSVGSALAGADCPDINAVIEEADRKMYAAKRASRVLRS